MTEPRKAKRKKYHRSLDFNKMHTDMMRLLHEKNMSQVDLQNEIKVSRVTLWKLGKGKKIGNFSLLTIAEWLGKDINYYLNNEISRS